MKRRVLKLFASVAIIAVFLCGLIFATGCYAIKGVKMKDLVGTYELTTYTAKTDRKTESEMVMYMIIKADGTGYYVYQDKDTELYCAELRCKFTTSEKDASTYEYVACEFDNEGDWTKFGINKKILNFNDIQYKQLEWGEPLEKDYDISVRLQKVSSATDLSYVSEELKTDLKALPYGLPSLARVYQYDGIMLNDVYLTDEEIAAYGLETPIYHYIRLDVFNDKAQTYSLYPSDEEQYEKEYEIAITGTTGAYTIEAQAVPWQLEKASGSFAILYMTEEVEDAEGNPQTLKRIFTIAYALDYDLTSEIANKLS